ncbi:fibronectin type III-like domain-contianing protein [Kitasatospora griseola]|uniref:fibronectin type III-like domain-contianing protein n=1 Tax=Kitasatospora griseola TaxID=2064 RepID=UPI0038266D42
MHRRTAQRRRALGHRRAGGRQRPLAWSYESVEARLADGSAEELAEVTVRVRNIGQCPGREVVQVYLATDGSDRSRPDRQLDGFAVVEAAPGATATARIALPRRAVQSWDTTAHAWRTNPGVHTVEAGRHAGDRPLTLALVRPAGLTPDGQPAVAVAPDVRDGHRPSAEVREPEAGQPSGQVDDGDRQAHKRGPPGSASWREVGESGVDGTAVAEESDGHCRRGESVRTADEEVAHRRPRGPSDAPPSPVAGPVRQESRPDRRNLQGGLPSPALSGSGDGGRLPVSQTFRPLSSTADKRPVRRLRPAPGPFGRTPSLALQASSTILPPRPETGAERTSALLPLYGRIGAPSAEGTAMVVRLCLPDVRLLNAASTTTAATSPRPPRRPARHRLSPPGETRPGAHAGGGPVARRAPVTAAGPAGDHLWSTCCRVPPAAGAPCGRLETAGSGGSALPGAVRPA